MIFNRRKETNVSMPEPCKRLRHTLQGVAGLAALCLAGCGAHELDAPDRNTRHGDQPGAPQRIVCGSPAVAEIVFALGAANRVVGVSDHTVYPPEATKKASVGGWVNPNRERLLVLHPDLIISQGQHEKLADFCSEYEIAFHTVNLDSLADLYNSIESLAGMLDVTGRGTDLIQKIRTSIQFVSSKTAALQPQRVLLLFGRSHGNLSGLGTIGTGTFLDDLLRLAGGTNIFADATGAYPQISKEALLVRSPEVILEVIPGNGDKKTIALLRDDWDQFSEMPAVRDNRVHYLTNDFLLIPGPRVGRIALELAKAIHPEAFRE